MVIINPNIPHTEMSLSDRPLEYIVLGIDGLFFSFQQPGAPEGYTVFSFREQRERILFYLNTLLPGGPKPICPIGMPFARIFWNC